MEAKFDASTIKKIQSALLRLAKENQAKIIPLINKGKKEEEKMAIKIQ
jgi:hypothetical protein